MPEKTRTCPQCGGTMLFRLGEFQCQQCSNTMPAAQAEAADPRQPTFSSGRPGSYVPGEQGRASGRSGYTPGAAPAGEAAPKLGQSEWDPGAQYRAAPPPPSTGMMAGYGVGGTPPAGLYGTDPQASSALADDPLRTEKYIYFGVWAVQFIVVGAFMTMVMDELAKTTGGSAMGDVSGGVTIGFIIAGLLGGVIMWWVLFNNQVWAKYTCAGCAALGLVSTVIGLLGGAAMTKVAVFGPFAVPLNLLSLAMGCWYISILWRDAQRIQGVAY